MFGIGMPEFRRATDELNLEAQFVPTTLSLKLPAQQKSEKGAVLASADADPELGEL